MQRKIRKGIQTLTLCTVLILGTVLTVNAGAGENQKAARDASRWSVASYPGDDSSDTASSIRDGGSFIHIFVGNYSSEPVGGQPVYASSPQSSDRIAINSTATRDMGYKSSVGKNDRIDVNFYAYSSTDRIIADGHIYTP